ncbi:MAG: hypothetical protein EB084_04855 [Proteobacteria bacterium]|nr:hypothetical protein [Pseudomonadota bacterium]
MIGKSMFHPRCAPANQGIAVPRRVATVTPAVARASVAPGPSADDAAVGSAARATPAAEVPAGLSAAEARLARIAATKARSWHDEVIYMAMTDRFHNGDKTNDAGTDPTNPNRFHGGDWQGLIDKLDYLADLGVTTLWISPLPEQIRDFLGTDGYHGYWTKDFTRPEPSFGTVDKLRELVDKAHEKGLKVLVDLVVNHLGYGAPMAEDPAYHDWFHHQGNVNLTLQRNMEKGKLSGLPDFAQENPVVSRWLIDQCKAWIDKADIDGFRLEVLGRDPRPRRQQLLASWRGLRSGRRAHVEVSERGGHGLGVRLSAQLRAAQHHRVRQAVHVVEHPSLRRHPSRSPRW